MSEPSGSDDPPAWLQPTTAEWGMWQAFRNGSAYDLRCGEPELDDPSSEHDWGPERTVRARVISTLLLPDHSPAALPGRVASLHLTGAYIIGTLNLAGGSVESYVELRHCRFAEELRMPETQLSTVRLVHCYLPRLEATRASVGGDLHLARCEIPDGVRLTDAGIGTDLVLNESRIGSRRRSRAIAADGLNVAQELKASLLATDGEVNLRGATVGGSLFMYGSVLRNDQGRYALNAPQLTVDQFAHFADDVPERQALTQGSTPATGTHLLPDGMGGAGRHRTKRFECHGGVKLDDGRFGSQLVLDNARFQLARDQELSLRRVTTPELCFTSQAPERGVIVLSGASVEKLVDKVGSWPRDERLWMAGFVYQELIPRGRFSLQQRLGWLATATPEYSPRPYEQLATVYRNRGEDAPARLVLLAKQRRRRETLPLAGKVWGYLQDWTVAYGYRPAQAALWMAVLWLLGMLLFSGDEPDPLKSGEAPEWNVALYTLDLLLPVITFGQDLAWRMDGWQQWASASMILLGWFLATTVAAGATRLLRRQ
ncbi:oxidoreductase [Streptomyces oceani]|uniref:Oxidoreductase n=1 Tax=Streptomyces oceani TaxID=1075402 RepID=A0A1E7JZG3_9ACTN|nr:oxidoreductase [Streptomyces oceani]OEU97061.1 oxidoreductase [Streptomyces oceani]